jgi:uncharacterized membrane protein
MLVRRILMLLLALLALVALGQLLYWAPQLPDRVASHFDLSNHANGWMDRTPFLVLTGGVELLMAVLFGALPLLLGRIPDALINLPHKEYWLAPARRSESIARVSSSLLGVGVATMVLLLVIFQGVFALNAGLARASANGSATQEVVLTLPFIALMAGYLGAVAIVLASMVWHFRKPAV